MSDLLSAERIDDALRGRFGRPLRYHESIDSTNRDALEWAAAGAPEGAVVTTDHQTAGRGRWGRSWSSTPGRLLQLSVILRPGLPVTDAGVVTTAVGLACAESVDELTGVPAQIKWPNDVTVGGRKLAGILVESVVTGAT
ncbi:MAG: biotin--[acetyl-CoA-carboxylase] ligase, partial [Actinomycetota bacterium]|nr:biotin--[acetyl-CoA-carboxylase] ligase [Actinomycetota bacterium]